MHPLDHSALRGCGRKWKHLLAPQEILHLALSWQESLVRDFECEAKDNIQRPLPAFIEALVASNGDAFVFQVLTYT